LFVITLPIYAFLLSRRSIKSAGAFLSISLVLSAAIHALFYFLDPADYSPLHILGKADEQLNLPLRIVAAISSFGALWFVFTKTILTALSWVLVLGVAIAVPIVFPALGALWVIKDATLQRWNGANYLMILSPILCTYIALNTIPS
jgi:hypothetical protein